MTKQQYIEYLICTPGGNYTCTNLANPLDGEPGTSHDTISDFLRREKLTGQVCDVVGLVFPVSLISFHARYGSMSR